MRKTAIDIHNNQRIELFVNKYEDGFEFWAVGIVRGHRLVLDHHLTHDNLEAHLEYARPEDLIWSDGKYSQIPAEKHKLAIAQEETIARRVFWDYEHRGPGQIQSVTCHLGAIDFLTIDRKSLIAAKKMMLGRWTDGILTFALEANNRLEWSCVETAHWLSVGDPGLGHVPNWWNFAKWRIAFVDDRHGRGTHLGVLHISEKELHLAGGNHLHRMAHIFRKIKIEL